ncbi:MAG: hypothetical protein IPO66_07400 [Rhodanobacteraceae bacterium]|nr:hypothetical protein [Rhodanobacteraceae bacterium]
MMVAYSRLLMMMIRADGPDAASDGLPADMQDDALLGRVRGLHGFEGFAFEGVGSSGVLGVGGHGQARQK